MNKQCIICDKVIIKRKKEGSRDWSARRFCGIFCYRIHQRLNPNKGTFKSGNHPISEFKKGHPKSSNAYTFPTGKEHPNWRGGLPKCEHCGIMVSARTSKLCVKCRNKYQIKDKAPNWKGDGVGYHGLHGWARKILGKPSHCNFCRIKGKYFVRKNGIKHWSIQWANKSRKYVRDINDWIALCISCHKKYDKSGFKKGYTPWNKPLV